MKGRGEKGRGKEEERKEYDVFVGVTGRVNDFSLQLCPHDRTVQTTSMVAWSVGLRTEGHHITALWRLQGYLCQRV